MTGIHWLALFVGYLVGSFFGVQKVLGMFGARAG